MAQNDWEIMSWGGVDVEKAKAEKKKQRDLVLFKKFMELNFYRIKKIEEIIKKPEPKEQYRIITHQSFNSFSILLWLIKDMKFSEVYMTTFSIDQKTSKAICDLVESAQETNFTLMITSLLKYDRKSRNNLFVDLAKKFSNFKYIETFNHTKIIMGRSGNNYYVCEGSGNLSANARIEQYLFENSKETYNFHKSWIDDIQSFAANKDTTITN